MPELDERLIADDFYLENREHASVLSGAAFNEQSIPITKDQWIRQLNEIYCQSISIECEHIQVRLKR